MSWPIKKIKDICVVGAGNSAPQNESFFRNGTYPFFRTSDVGQVHIGEVVDAADKLNDHGIKDLKLFKKGTILMPKSGASTFLNHRVIMAVDGYVSSHLATLQANEAMISTKYLFYFLNTIDARDLIQDHKYPSLNIPNIENIDIPLPPLSEQEDIIAKLDTLLDGIEKAKQNTIEGQKIAENLFDSVLNDAFSKNKPRSVEKLAALAEFRNGINYTKSSRGDLISVVGVKDFQKNYEVPQSGLAEVRIDGHLSEEDALRTNDILVVRSNGNPSLIGRAMLVTSLFDQTSFSGFTIRIRLTSDAVLASYVCLYLKTYGARKHLIEGGNGINIKSLNQTTLSSLDVAIPTLAEQKATVKKLTSAARQTSELESIYEQKLSLLEDLRTAILRQAFSSKPKASVAGIAKGSSVNEKASSIPSPYMRNQVHAAIIEQVARDGGWTTEVAVAKYDHLLQEVFGLSLGYEFATHQFGPFDTKIKRLIFSGLGGNKWFTKRNGMLVFGSNVRGLLFRQSNLYKNAQVIMQELSALGVTKMDADGVELLSTVCHSIKETRSNTLKDVRAFMSEWKTDGGRTKAQKFPEDRTQKCLDFINRNGLQRRLLQTV